MASGRAVERRIVTVLFADLVGFTALSERLDPEDVALVQDAYFDAVRATIGRHGGQLEKFIGDAAMTTRSARCGRVSRSSPPSSGSERRSGSKRARSLFG